MMLEGEVEEQDLVVLQRFLVHIHILLLLLVRWTIDTLMLLMEKLFLGYLQVMDSVVSSLEVAVAAVVSVLETLEHYLQARKQVLVEEQHLPYKVLVQLLTLVVEVVVDLVLLHQKTPVK